MTDQDKIEETLRELGQRIASRGSIADDVMRRIDRAGARHVRRDSAPHGIRLLFHPLPAAAAAAMLIVGVLIGVSLPRQSPGDSAGARLGPRVQIDIQRVEGTMLTRHRGDDFWRALTGTSAIHLGDTFHTLADSELELALPDGSSLRLEAGSTLSLDAADGRTQLDLRHGTLHASLQSPHPPFTVVTPHARAEALGTAFTITVEYQGDTP